MATRLPDRINTGGVRSNPPTESLARAVNDAIDAVYGPDYSYEARSGYASSPVRGSPGTKTGRHVYSIHGEKSAADWKIYDPNGRQLAGRALEPFARHWAANYGSIGVNARPGNAGANFTHLDLIQRGDLGPGQAVAWGYGNIGFSLDPIKSLAGTGPLYSTWSKPEIALAQMGGPVRPGQTAIAQSIERAPGTLANLFGREDFRVPQADVSPLGSTTMRRGRVRGQRVEALQETLKELGYYNGEIDGIYGKGTEAAVKQYQKATGLEQTGVVDTKTLSYIEPTYRDIQQQKQTIGYDEAIDEFGVPRAVGAARGVGPDVAVDSPTVVPGRPAYDPTQGPPRANPLAATRPDFNRQAVLPRANPLSATRPNFDTAIPTPRANPLSTARPNFDVSIPRPRSNPTAQPRQAMPGLSAMDDAPISAPVPRANPTDAPNVLTQEQRNALSAELRGMVDRQNDLQALREAAVMGRRARTEGSIPPDRAEVDFNNIPSSRGIPGLSMMDDAPRDFTTGAAATRAGEITPAMRDEARRNFGQDFAMDRLRELSASQGSIAPDFAKTDFAMPSGPRGGLPVDAGGFAGRYGDAAAAGRALSNMRQSAGVQQAVTPAQAQQFKSLQDALATRSAWGQRVQDVAQQRALDQINRARAVAAQGGIGANFDLSGALNFTAGSSPRRGEPIQPRSVRTTSIPMTGGFAGAAQNQGDSLRNPLPNGFAARGSFRSAQNLGFPRPLRDAVSPRSYSDTERFNVGRAAQAATADQNRLASNYSTGTPAASAPSSQTYSSGAKPVSARSLAAQGARAAANTQPQNAVPSAYSGGAIPTPLDAYSLAAWGAANAAAGAVPAAPAVPAPVIPELTVPVTPPPQLPPVARPGGSPPAVSGPRYSPVALGLRDQHRSRGYGDTYISQNTAKGFSPMVRSTNARGGSVSSYVDSRGRQHNSTSFGRFADPKAGSYYSRGSVSSSGGSSSRDKVSRTTSRSSGGSRSSGSSSIDKARNPNRGGFGD